MALRIGNRKTACRQNCPPHCLWQQSENVVFEQSRNVVLTAPSFGDAGRTTTDDPGRKRPAGNAEEDEKEVDYAECGGGRTGLEHTASAAAVGGDERGWR